MSVITIPRSVREHLGDEASEDLAALINDIDIGARKDAIAIAEERFERRLVEESGKLRVEIGKINERITLEIGKINERITLEIGKINERITLEIGKINERITLEIGKVNERISEETGKLHVELEKYSKENIKWMFLFWIGQLAATFAIIKFLVVK
ncbi:LA_3696 family protein [Candidatus Magnetominusculus xianensis]|uniref:DUF1640 domain-containing protein n=1 Tax=Candidatus Magnetominusculus xianensis TaxID=1748249 RepID=A0ABR5SKW2_9BACT|nr:coiled-coil domain-containing protein [Candidatus Magnetominusculus xianensis]KWT94962.1 hypothetical protein ASN18_0112 [Candidatus Magnetominusculus xianensis]MBF0405208.1 DUF1640 domain-containing protein [Nitrospirota bacterium]